MSLSSCISGADQERICFHAGLGHQNSTSKSNPHNSNGESFTHEVDLAVYHGQLIIVKAFVADHTEVEARQDGALALSGIGTQSCVCLEKNGNPKHKQVSPLASAFTI